MLTKVQKFGIIFLILGVIALTLATFGYMQNEAEDKNAALESASRLTNLQQEIFNADFEVENSILEIDGEKYIGYVEIPKLQLQLPIFADWSYENLTLAPCRHFGLIETQDLVIAGHNYKSHFGYLYKLEIGDTVTITAANAEIYEYEVAKIETLDSTDVEEVQNSGYPLTLYTCTTSKEARTVIFCTYKTETN